MKNRVAICGPYPPPYGGISVHIYRIEQLLIKERIPYVIYDHYFSKKNNVIPTNKSPFWYIKFLFSNNNKVVHFHQFFIFHFIYYFVFTWLNRTTKTMVTIHSERLLHYPKYFRNFLLFFMKHSYHLHVISVSKKLEILLNKKNIPAVFLPAYVPPIPENPVKLNLSDNKVHFLFSVSRVTKKSSETLYDIPLIFEFLKKNKERFHMTFMLNKTSSDLDYLQDLIHKYGLQKHIDLIYDQEIIDYLPNFKFLVRTNNSDGYGVSLQEALDLGVPAIGSDTCLRPKGTVLFKTGDIADLTQKINMVVNNDKEKFMQQKEDLTYHHKLIETYKDLLYS
jgi:glycosyltransferase involved in cell wall biosynthesis